MIKLSLFLTLLLTFPISLAAQKPDEVLATATGHKFTTHDLSDETQSTLAKLPDLIKAARSAILEEMINTRVVSLEAAAQAVTPGRLLAQEKAKAAEPTDAEIKAAYDANRNTIGDATLEKVREQIVAYLRGPAEEKFIGNLLTGLRGKYKVSVGKDINSAALAATDVVATVGSKPITSAEYNKFAAYELYDIKAEMADRVLDDLDQAIFNVLAADEAKALGIDTRTLIGREITDKLKDFTDDERSKLNIAFGKRLLDKYKVVLLFKMPDAPVEPVSPDDDPAKGAATAQVTIIMFSDFQCSACSASHPMLQEAMAAFPGKIRFVVRDYPLESIHKNSLLAARAAAAANAQGKFFEYIDILYKNQSALDVDSLKKYATQLGLNAAQFDIDFNSDKLLAEIKKDIADGEALNINSTPTIFVNGRRAGVLSVEGFKAAINRALAK